DLRTQRDIAEKAAQQARKKLVPDERITARMVAQFDELMQHALTQDDPPLRRAYLRAVVGKIEIDETEVRIHPRGNPNSTSAFRARNGTRLPAETTPRRVQLPAPMKALGKQRAAA
ncbi:hypothetical protein, partial [Palleronia pontilimi]|uniref:hypothetical protein n=1 Tax=Palleronia pontilimi TaxID=1964209 RepID=UPI001BE45DBC